MKHSRRYQKAKEKIPSHKYYSLSEAWNFLQNNNQEKSKIIKISCSLYWHNQKNILKSKIILPHPLPNEKDGKFPPEEREIKTDKSGNIHALVGKSDFSTEQLTENYKIISSKITNMRPSNWKGEFLKSVTLSTAMGPGIKILLQNE